jgi:hypothetical protein
MISAINVNGFRSLTDVQLRLDEPLTLILGDNGAGKTSLAAAVELTLTGACEWTDARGAGYVSLIQHGAKAANIDVVCDERAIMLQLTAKSRSLAVNEHTGDKAQAALDLALPSKDLLRCMLRSDGFVGLKPKEQADLLFALAGGAVDVAWFEERLEDPEREALDVAFSTRLTGSELADSLYKQAYGMRTEANKHVKDVRPRAEAKPGPSPHKGRTGEQVEAELVKAREKLSAAQQALGKAEGGAAATSAAKARGEAAQKACAEARADLEAMGKAPSGALDGDGMAALRDTIKGLEKQVVVAQTAVAQAEASMKAIGEQLDALGTGEEPMACPLTPDVACPITQEQREAIRATLEHKRDGALDDQERATETAAGLDEQLDTAREALEAAQVANSAATEYASRKRELEAAISGQQAILDEVNALPTVIEPVVKRTQEVAEAQAAVMELETVARGLWEHETAVETWKRASADLLAAEERAAMLDALVKKLSPDGLPAQAIAETIGKVLTQINKALVEFTDFGVKFDGELQVGYPESGDDLLTTPVPVSLLSESEKLRVGAAISVAFAKLTGFHFVLVDAADRLDTHNRGPLLAMLLNSGVQALVTATPMNGATCPEGCNGGAVEVVGGAMLRCPDCGLEWPRPAPQVDGLDVYWLWEGEAVPAVYAEEAAEVEEVAE